MRLKRRATVDDWDALFEPPKSHWLRRLFLFFVCMTLLVVILVGVAGVLLYHRMAADLPQVTDLEHYQPSLVTKLYDRDGVPIADFFIEKRILVPLEDVPLHVRQATIASEDRRFYAHSGIDYWGILRATWVNFQHKETREGASTITQQVARTLFLNRERTMARKIREAILAHRIEQRYTKDQILEIYLNQIFYGHNAYGIEAASQLYFGKAAKELTLSEGALIAGLPPSPNTYSPLKNFKVSLRRRDHVLNRMLEGGYLTPEQVAEARQVTIQIDPHPARVYKASYFVEYVRQYLEEQYGPTALYRGGFAVDTTIDQRLQQMAEKALKPSLVTLDKQYGIYQGPVRRLDLKGDATVDAKLIEAATKTEDGDMTVREGESLPGVVLSVREASAVIAIKNAKGVLPWDGYSWIRETKDYEYRPALSKMLQRGDVVQVKVRKVDPTGKSHTLVLEQSPLVQGALLTIDVSSGHILAMVGGYDFNGSQFNRATQAMRQPGSAFKPLIYAAALEDGLTPALMIQDSPLTEDIAGAKGWRPGNSDGKYNGPMTMRAALTYSRNLPTVRLLDKIGVHKACAFARRVGITSPLGCYPSLALGSSDVTLLEMVAAYGVFANGGVYNAPTFITRIVDRYGKVLEGHIQEARRAISPEVAYLTTSMMESVVKHGTGKAVRVLERPVAGKTGTTNDYRDAWFVGYTPELVTGVWIGFDSEYRLEHGETGGKIAAPIWAEFMKMALKDRPVADFAIPPGVRFVRVGNKGGIPPAAAFEDGTSFEAFVDGTQPKVTISLTAPTDATKRKARARVQNTPRGESSQSSAPRQSSPSRQPQQQLPRPQLPRPQLPPATPPSDWRRDIDRLDRSAQLGAP